ncbi:hypothetical protein [Streptomyces sp. TRM64462]|uniref:hypothetical protein n=1 Tax=Streptomyces sp. TRM64462 TaxID=2741726 RepID=UPI001586AE21|nr:hypothetical protein [Streptomyces sp. TRM64462]
MPSYPYLYPYTHTSFLRRLVPCLAVALSALALLLLGCAEPALPSSGPAHVAAAAHGDTSPSCDTRQGEAGRPGDQRAPRQVPQDGPERAGAVPASVPAGTGHRPGAIGRTPGPGAAALDPLLVSCRWRI